MGQVTERVNMGIATANFDGPMDRSRNLWKFGGSKEYYGRNKMVDKSQYLTQG